MVLSADNAKNDAQITLKNSKFGDSSSRYVSISSSGNIDISGDNNIKSNILASEISLSSSKGSIKASNSIIGDEYTSSLKVIANTEVDLSKSVAKADGAYIQSKTSSTNLSSANWEIGNNNLTILSGNYFTDASGNNVFKKDSKGNFLKDENGKNISAAKNDEGEYALSKEDIAKGYSLEKDFVYGGAVNLDGMNLKSNSNVDIKGGKVEANGSKIKSSIDSMLSINSAYTLNIDNSNLESGMINISAVGDISKAGTNINAIANRGQIAQIYGIDLSNNNGYDENGNDLLGGIYGAKIVSSEGNITSTKTLNSVKTEGGSITGDNVLIQALNGNVELNKNILGGVYSRGVSISSKGNIDLIGATMQGMNLSVTTATKTLDKEGKVLTESGNGSINITDATLLGKGNVVINADNNIILGKSDAVINSKNELDITKGSIMGVNINLNSNNGKISGSNAILGDKTTSYLNIIANDEVNLSNSVVKAGGAYVQSKTKSTNLSSSNWEIGNNKLTILSGDYITDASGNNVFKKDSKGNFLKDGSGKYIPAKMLNGQPTLSSEDMAQGYTLGQDFVGVENVNLDGMKLTSKSNVDIKGANVSLKGVNLSDLGANGVITQFTVNSNNKIDIGGTISFGKVSTHAVNDINIAANSKIEATATFKQLYTQSGFSSEAELYSFVAQNKGLDYSKMNNVQKADFESLVKGGYDTLNITSDKGNIIAVDANGTFSNNNKLTLLGFGTNIKSTEGTIKFDDNSILGSNDGSAAFLNLFAGNKNVNSTDDAIIAKNSYIGAADISIKSDKGNIDLSCVKGDDGKCKNGSSTNLVSSHSRLIEAGGGLIGIVSSVKNPNPVLNELKGALNNLTTIFNNIKAKPQIDGLVINDTDSNNIILTKKDGTRIDGVKTYEELNAKVSAIKAKSVADLTEEDELILNYNKSVVSRKNAESNSNSLVAMKSKVEDFIKNGVKTEGDVAVLSNYLKDLKTYSNNLKEANDLSYIDTVELVTTYGEQIEKLKKEQRQNYEGGNVNLINVNFTGGANTNIIAHRIATEFASNPKFNLDNQLIMDDSSTINTGIINMNGINVNNIGAIASSFNLDASKINGNFGELKGTSGLGITLDGSVKASDVLSYIARSRSAENFSLSSITVGSHFGDVTYDSQNLKYTNNKNQLVSVLDSIQNVSLKADRGNIYTGDINVIGNVSLDAQKVLGAQKDDNNNIIIDANNNTVYTDLTNGSSNAKIKYGGGLSLSVNGDLTVSNLVKNFNGYNANDNKANINLDQLYATGDLILNSKKGSFTNDGYTVKAGGALSVTALGDITNKTVIKKFLTTVNFDSKGNRVGAPTKVEVDAMSTNNVGHFYETHTESRNRTYSVRGTQMCGGGRGETRYLCPNQQTHTYSVIDNKIITDSHKYVQESFSINQAIMEGSSVSLTSLTGDINNTTTMAKFSILSVRNQIKTDKYGNDSIVKVRELMMPTMVDRLGKETTDSASKTLDKALNNSMKSNGTVNKDNALITYFNGGGNAEQEFVGPSAVIRAKSGDLNITALKGKLDNKSSEITVEGNGNAYITALKGLKNETITYNAALNIGGALYEDVNDYSQTGSYGQNAGPQAKIEVKNANGTAGKGNMNILLGSNNETTNETADLNNTSGSITAVGNLNLVATGNLNNKTLLLDRGSNYYSKHKADVKGDVADVDSSLYITDKNFADQALIQGRNVKLTVKGDYNGTNSKLNALADLDLDVTGNINLKSEKAIRNISYYYSDSGWDKRDWEYKETTKYDRVKESLQSDKGDMTASIQSGRNAKIKANYLSGVGASIDIKGSLNANIATGINLQDIELKDTKTGFKSYDVFGHRDCGGCLYRKYAPTEDISYNNTTRSNNTFKVGESMKLNLNENDLKLTGVKMDVKGDASIYAKSLLAISSKGVASDINIKGNAKLNLKGNLSLTESALSVGGKLKESTVGGNINIYNSQAKDAIKAKEIDLSVLGNLTSIGGKVSIGEGGGKMDVKGDTTFEAVGVKKGDAMMYNNGTYTGSYKDTVTSTTNIGSCTSTNATCSEKVFYDRAINSTYTEGQANGGLFASGNLEFKTGNLSLLKGAEVSIDKSDAKIDLTIKSNLISTDSLNSLSYYNSGKVYSDSETQYGRLNLGGDNKYIKGIGGNKVSVPVVPSKTKNKTKNIGNTKGSYTRTYTNPNYVKSNGGAGQGSSNSSGNGGNNGGNNGY